jgi:hypothetical protein
MYHASQPKFERCDVVVLPEGLESFGMFDSKRFPDIERIGYEATVRNMSEIEQAVERSRHGN